MEPKEPRSRPTFIEHQLEVVDFQVALELVFRPRTDVRLIHSDELIAAFPDRHNPLLMRVCVSHHRDGQEIGLIPDLIFGIAFPDGSSRAMNRSPLQSSIA
jgi:hypothetical protein